jgi:hypothetical protein
MEKLFEKKNLGIPVTILALLAYFIGYYLTMNFSGLFVAVVFAVIVFALDFDEKVKNAVKQSYFIGLFFSLIYLALDILGQLSDMLTPTDYTRTYFLQKLVNNLHRYAVSLFNILVLVVFIILVFLVLLKKDVKINFIFNLFGEGAPKPQPQPMPQMQQPIPPMYQQVPPMPQVQNPLPPQPQQPAPRTCPKCGTVNREGAAFCASCGTKL